jgi:putative membrane-bound dehydrogenase-like protein
MQVVWHDFARDAAILVNEPVAEINPKDILPVREFMDDLIYLQNLSALVVDVLAAREDRTEENFRLRQPGAKLLDDHAHTLGNLFGGVVFAVGIVRADHEDGGFWTEAVDIAVVETPEDVLGAIAADAEIDGVIFGVILFPHFLARAFPALRDRVADKDDLRVFASFGGAFVQEIVANLPIRIARHGINCGMRGKSNLGRSNECKQSKEFHGRECSWTAEGFKRANSPTGAFSFQALSIIISAISESMHSGIRPKNLPFLLLILIILSIVIRPLSCRATTNFHLPDNFTIHSATDKGRVRFPMFAVLDDQGRLFVAESSGLDLYEELQKLTRRCRITLLEDTNNDGIFEKSQIFADQLVFPMGLAWREGKLYVADPPDLITLEDTDGDNRADKRTVLLTGFGHTDNGSLHGLTFGPEGWLYMTMGQPDGFRIKRSDGKIIEGKNGALLRCRPDGSALEVVCRGFENLLEVIFMPTGEIIGTDNWFFLPQDGVRDALVHLVPGGVYPLNAHAAAQRDLFFSGELLPALQVFPAVALSGLMRYGGRAFPATMQGSLFSAQFNTRKIVRHSLNRYGSTFQSTEEDFLTSDDPDFHPSDLLEDSDGSILIVDTGSWYVHHCPTGRIRKSAAEGGLYRVRSTNSSGRSAAKIKEAGDLNAWAENALLLTEIRPAPTDRRMGMALDDYLLDPKLPADFLAVSLRTISRSFYTFGAVSNYLFHPAAHVRLAAAEAIAARRPANAVHSVAQALAAESDPFIVHTLIYALHQLADTSTLENLLKDVRPQVRRAALILLDQEPHRKLQASTVIEALTDPPLRRAALNSFVRHPEWAGEAVSLIGKLVAGEDAIEQIPALLELIPPSMATPEVRDLVSETVSAEGKPVALRLVMLDLLSQSHGSNDTNLTRALQAGLRSGDPALIRAALRSVDARRVETLEDDLSRIAHAKQQTLALRLHALRALVRGRPELDAASFSVATTALSAAEAPSLRLSAAELLAAAELRDAQLRTFISAAEKDRLISPSLVISAAQRAKTIAAEPLLGYLLAAVERGWQISDTTLAWLEQNLRAEPKLVELRSAARNNLEDRVAKLSALEPLLHRGDPNAGHQLFLGKLACATCHRVGKHGGLVGPDLTRIGAIRSGRDLIESLVLPSATIAQGYETYDVTLADGESLTGIRVRQPDEAFVLRDSSGAETRLQPSQVQKAERLQTSLMPEGLVSNLAEQERRDLLAYLQSLK